MFCMVVAVYVRQRPGVAKAVPYTRLDETGSRRYLQACTYAVESDYNGPKPDVVSRLLRRIRWTFC